MTSCSFVIQGEPVPCARARVIWAKGKMLGVTPRKTSGYEQLVGFHALASRPREWRQDWASYSLTIAVYRAIRRGDGDNYAKAVADGCTGILWTNDSSIHRWVIEIHDDLVHPRIEVTVSMLGDVALAAARKARTADHVKASAKRARTRAGR